jgi:O-antigen/teichoic acid export membrane protein
MIFKFSNYTRLLTFELFFQVFEKLIKILLGIVIIKKLSNYLGPENYGSLIFIETNYLLLLGFSGFGLSPFITKIFAEKKPDWQLYIFNGLIFFAVVSLFFFTVFNLFLFNLLSFPNKQELFYVSLLLLLNPIYFIEYYNYSQNKLRYNSLIRLISYLICFCLKILAIEFELKLKEFVMIMIIEALITLALLSIKTLKKNEIKINLLKIDFFIIKDIFKGSVFIFLYGLGLNLFSKIDILMVQEFLTQQDLGNYAASIKIITFIYGFPIILGNTFYPRILKSNNDETLTKMYFFSFWAIFLLFIIIYFLRYNIIELLYNSEFANVQEIFNVSILPIAIVGISATYIKVMYKNNLQISLFKRSVFGIFLNIFLNYFLIQTYGVIGVSYATVSSIFIVEFIYDFFDYKTNPYHRHKLKSIFMFSFIYKNIKLKINPK